jgi:hypothetical protein
MHLVISLTVTWTCCVFCVAHIMIANMCLLEMSPMKIIDSTPVSLYCHG